MIALLVPLALLCGGTAAGVMLGNALGPAALSLRQSYSRYVETITFMWPRYDPLLPLLNGAAFVLNGVVAVLAPATPATVLFAAAAVLLAGLMAVSVARNVPINKYVTSLDPAREPADWAERDPRAAWHRWNTVRVVLALVALVAALAGTATLL